MTGQAFLDGRDTGMYGAAVNRGLHTPPRVKPDYNTPYFQAIKARRHGLHPVARHADAGVRGFADTASYGGVNYVAAAADTLANPYPYSQNLEGERYIDHLDSEGRASAGCRQGGRGSRGAGGWLR